MRADIRIAGLLALVVGCGSRSVSPAPERETGGTRDISQTEGSSEVPWSPGDPHGTDGVAPGKTTVSQIQSSDASVNCTTEGITNPAKGLAIADIVVVSPRFVASVDKTSGQPKLHGYYVAEVGLEEAAPFSGILLVVDAAADTDFPLGRVLSVTADYTEFYCFSELKAKGWQEVGDAAVPAPLLLTDLSPLENGGDPAAAEPYEGVLVTIANVTITRTSASDGKGWFEVGQGIQVINDFGVGWKPVQGMRLQSLTGAIKYHFGKYRIAPRSLEDIVEEVVAEPFPEVIEPDVSMDGEVVAPKGKVFDIQASDTSVNCTNEGNNTIQKGLEVGPVVVTSPVFSASSGLDGFYVSDFPVGGSVAYTGILVVVVKGAGVQVTPGDEVVLKGDYKEYYCMSQIYATSVQKTGTSPPPTPFVLNDSSPFHKGGGKAAEPYEGLVITLRDLPVTATTSSDGKGWFRVGNDIEVLNDFQVSWTPKVGQHLATLTGAVKYHWGKYRIVPRSLVDIEVAQSGEPTPEPVPEPVPDAYEAVEDAVPEDVPSTKKTVLQIQAGEASVNCTQVKDQTIASGIALADVVVVSPRYSASATLHGYYVQDPVTTWPIGSNGKYTGMLLVVPKNLNTNFQPGDLISVVGDYKEFYCLTEVVATSAQKVGTAEVPEPLGVASAAFENGGTAAVCEPYEGLRVTLTDLEVTDVTGGTQPSWWFQVGNKIHVADDFGLKASVSLTTGQTISRLTGAVKYSYGKYLLVPFTAADIEVP